MFQIKPRLTTQLISRQNFLGYKSGRPEKIKTTELKDTHTNSNPAGTVINEHSYRLAIIVMYLDIFLLIARILRVQEKKQPPALTHPWDRSDNC